MQLPYQILVKSKLRRLGVLVLFLALSFVVQGPAPVEARDILKPDRKPVFCRQFDRHSPSADVTYQPGVDATGRPVAPADLPSSTQFQLPEEFSFPLTVDVIERTGLDERFSGLEGDLNLGEVKVSGNNVTLNGEAVPDLSRRDIVALCVTKPGIR